MALSIHYPPTNVIHYYKLNKWFLYKSDNKWFLYKSDRRSALMHVSLHANLNQRETKI